MTTWSIARRRRAHRFRVSQESLARDLVVTFIWVSLLIGFIASHLRP